MSVYPITVVWLPTVSQFGHSNCDGWACTDKLFAKYADFLTFAGNSPTAAKNDPAKAYWKNIYVFTSPQPFPGASHTPVTSNVGDGQWLEMTIANVRANGDPHPHPHPFNYPNNAGACYPRYLYNGWDLSVFVGFHPTPSSSKTFGTRHGVEIPLMHFWRDYWRGQVGLTKVAYSSSFVLPVEGGTDPSIWFDPNFGGPGQPASAQVGPLYVPSAINPALGQQYAYWNPRLQFDWSASTDRLFKMWYDKHVGAQAALKAINPNASMDIRMVDMHVGDNDSSARNPTILKATWKNAIVALIRKIREAIDANGWSSIPASEITFVFPGVYKTYTNGPDPKFDSVGFINGVYQEIAADDPRCVWIDTSKLTLLVSGDPTTPVDNYNPTGFGSGHLGHTGYVDLAKLMMDGWTANQVGSWFDAISERDRMTLGEFKKIVKETYDRGITNSDLKDTLLTDAINASLRDTVNHLGQLAWWLERRIDVNLVFDSNGVAKLPRHVAHPVTVFNPIAGGQDITFRKVGRGDGGRVLITFEDTVCANSAGVYKMAVISWPPDVTLDGQLVPFPKQFSLWLALEVCSHIASSGSNTSSKAIFAGDAAEARRRAMQVVGDERAAYRDRLHAYGDERRRLNYGKGFGLV